MTFAEVLTNMIAGAMSAALGPVRSRLDALEAKPAVSDADRALLDQIAAFMGNPPAVPTDSGDGAITLPDINP